MKKDMFTVKKHQVQKTLTRFAFKRFSSSLTYWLKNLAACFTLNCCLCIVLPLLSFSSKGAKSSRYCVPTTEKIVRSSLWRWCEVCCDHTWESLYKKGSEQTYWNCVWCEQNTVASSKQVFHIRRVFPVGYYEIHNFTFQHFATAKEPEHEFTVDTVFLIKWILELHNRNTENTWGTQKTKI